MFRMKLILQFQFMQLRYPVIRPLTDRLFCYPKRICKSRNASIYRYCCFLIHRHSKSNLPNLVNLIYLKDNHTSKAMFT